MMKTRKISAVIVAFALMAVLAKPQITFAQVTPAPIRGSWEGLKAVPPGDEVSVRLRNGQKLKGRLTSVSDTVLTLEHGNRTTDVTRADALRVHRVVSKSAKRAALIGLGIGAGAGLGGTAIFAHTGDRGGEADLYGLVIMVACAGGGALIGYIIGSHKQKALVYETR
jgi:hypothetical protein